MVSKTTCKNAQTRWQQRLWISKEIYLGLPNEEGRLVVNQYMPRDSGAENRKTAKVKFQVLFFQFDSFLCCIFSV
jgi:hypothetical protein